MNTKNNNQAKIKQWLNEGNILLEEKQLEKAIKKYSQCITIDANNVCALKQLAKIHETQKDIDRAIEYRKRIIQIRPSSSVAHRLLAKLLLQKGDLNGGIASCKQAIALDPNQPDWVYKKSKNPLDRKNHERTFTYQSIWNTINQKKHDDLDEANYSYPVDLNHQSVIDYFETNSQYRIVLCAKKITQEDKLFLEKNRISWNYLRSIKNSHNITSESSTQKLKYIIPPKTRSSRDFEETRFHTRMVEKGYIDILCPISGKLLMSNQSFALNVSTVAYRFIGEEVFYLICGGVLFTKGIIYFPKKEIVIQTHNTLWSKVERDQIASLINQLKSFAVIHWSQIIANFTFQGTKKTAIILSHANNLLHFLRDGLAGIQKLSDRSILKQVDAIFSNPVNQYFGDIEKLYEEIDANQIKIIQVENKNIFTLVLKDNYFVLKPSGSFITEKLANRILKVASTQCNSSFLSEVEEAKKCFPLVWIGIRSSTNRAWISQVDGLTNILRSIVSQFPKLGVVFDGVSRLANNESMTDREKEAIEKDREVSRQIIALLSDHDIKCYDTVGCMMYESLVWAKTVDCYIAPFGAGLTKINSIANKPGIIHTNHHFLKKPIEFRNYTYERENTILPVYTPIDRVKMVSEEQSRFMRHNYDCNWQWIYQEVIKIIFSLQDRNGSHSTPSN